MVTTFLSGQLTKLPCKPRSSSLGLATFPGPFPLGAVILWASLQFLERTLQFLSSFASWEGRPFLKESGTRCTLLGELLAMARLPGVSELADGQGFSTLLLVWRNNPSFHLKWGHWSDTEVLGTNRRGQSLESVSFRDTDMLASSPTLTWEYEIWAFNYIPHILS